MVLSAVGKGLRPGVTGLDKGALGSGRPRVLAVGVFARPDSLMADPEARRASLAENRATGAMSDNRV